MTYEVALPGSEQRLDLLDSHSTSVHRALRIGGVAGYEPPTMTTLLTLFDIAGPDFSFYDVGAHMGLYALVCSALFEPRIVRAFEPTPTIAAIARSVALSNDLDIDVVEVALGATDETAALHLSTSSDTCNSLAAGFKASERTVAVQVRRLDSELLRHGCRDDGPTVMKIDVETHEPAVLAGAVDTIERCRPAIVIEVLQRGGRDHGLELTAAMAPFGYSYYRLDAKPNWVAQPTIVGAAGSLDGDWLLTPEPLGANFAERWLRWRAAVAACGPERNSRLPVGALVRSAFVRGGSAEVVATGRRFLSGRLRRSGRATS